MKKMVIILLVSLLLVGSMFLGSGCPLIFPECEDNAGCQGDCIICDSGRCINKCPGDEICLPGGSCVECTSNADCPVDYKCENNKCIHWESGEELPPLP